MLSSNIKNKFIEVDQICRTCLGKFNNMRPLFGSSLDGMLRAVAQIQVEINDGLSKMICFQCVLHVSRSFRFLEQCRSSDAKLRSMIESNIDESSEDLIKPLTVPLSYELEQSENFVGSVNENSANNNEGDICIEPNHFEENNYNYCNDNYCDSTENVGFQHQQSEDSTNGDDKSNNYNSQITDLGIPLPAYLVKCHTCNKEFSKEKQLKRHLKTHDTVKRHHCDQCNMKFSEHCNLKKHMRRHTGELRNIQGKPHLCSICGKAFKWATSLAKHMNYHTKTNLLQCPSCPKTYVEKSTLKVHLRSHTGERPFTCSICSKSFVQSSSLQKHMMYIHSGEKRYKCPVPVCSKHFSQQGYVNTHMMRTHTEIKSFLCSECGKFLSSKAALTVHKRTHTIPTPS